MFRASNGLLCALILCSSAVTQAATYTFITEEDTYDQQYLATPIQLKGKIVDEGGAPLPGAAISLIAWGDSSANHGRSAVAGSNGNFSVNNLVRRNALVRVALAGFYSEILPVELQRPLAENVVDIGVVTLLVRYSGRARLIFGGDTMLARKYLDGDDDGIEGEAEDLIHLGSVASDSEAIFAFVRDLLSSDDHTVVNLETAVTADLSTPHSVKTHVFHTYPESLSIFRNIGIEAVSLGNNHFYDYLDIGAQNTIATLTSQGLGFFGGGHDETDARQNSHTPTINGLDFTFQGFEEQIGTNYGDTPLYLVAKDAPIVKAGALQLCDNNLGVLSGIQGTGRFTVPFFHGGTEYEWFQTSNMRDWFRKAIDQGAGMVLSAHPHYAQGISLYDPGSGPRYIFGSLGNFVFDMGYYEALRTYLAVVDVDYTPLGPRVSRVRLVPIWIDGYVPRLMVGDGLERMARHIGHLSTQEGSNGDGITGATVFPENGRIVVAASPSEYATDDVVDSRQFNLSSGKTGTFDLDPYASSDYLARITSNKPATCEVGRDFMVLGSFEDVDVDDSAHEGDRWSRSGSRFVENSVTRNGTAAAVILRKSSESSTSVMSIYNRIKVTPGKKLTITGFHKGETTAKMEIAVTWVKPDGTAISTTTKYTKSAGTYDWTRFNIDVTVPSTAGSMTVYLRGYPPSSGQSRYFFDDLAIVEWDSTSYNVTSGSDFATPNDWQYVRCSTTSSNETTLDLTLLHRVYESR